MSLSILKKLDSKSQWMAVVTISAAAIVNIYLIFLVVDANTGYRLGIMAFSPPLRAASLSAIGVVLLLQIIKTRVLKWDFLVCSFLCYLIIGAIVGLFNNGPTYEFARHLFAASTMLIGYWAGRFLTFEGAQIDRTLSFWAWISVLAGGLAWLLAYRMIESPGFSMSPVSQFLPLSVGLITGSIGLVALPLLMIAIGNKRDVILGAAAVFAVLFVRRYLANMNAGLRIVAGAMLTVIFALLIFLIVAQSTQFVAKLGVDLPANLAERSNRVMDFDSAEARRDGVLKPNEEVSPKPKEQVLEEKIIYDKDAIPSDFNSAYWRLEKLTSGRVSLAVSVYNSVADAKYGIMLGKGFGGSYTWRYWSDDANAWQKYILFQCDLMPLWIFLTSGSIMTILLMGGIIWKLVQIFLYSTRNTLDIVALLVIGSSIGMLFSFQPNVPLFWLFLGSMSARMQTDNPRSIFATGAS